MRVRTLAGTGLVFFVSAILCTPGALAQSAWKQHDVERPRPAAVTPLEQSMPVPPPADALVLFDGTDLSRWQAGDGTPTRWELADGAMISTQGVGYIQTRQAFGDVQLHVEWAAPTPVEGTGQGRGNSGVFLMGLYEVQVLDSYENETYADGQAAAVYGQHPPLFNAARPPGEWQAFDIFFRRPRFSSAGALLEPARMTVVHNGILVQNNAELWGPTMWLQSLPYEPHPDKLPLALQDHGNPVRYRNIWLLELPQPQLRPLADAYGRPTVTLTPEELDRFVGQYGTWTIRREGDRLRMNFFEDLSIDLVPHSSTRFSLRHTAGTLEFDLDYQGVPVGVAFNLGGTTSVAKRVR
ncbi:family 16 glycoside hydrolase [Gemmatimonadota bacterium]